MKYLGGTFTEKVYILLFILTIKYSYSAKIAYFVRAFIYACMMHDKGTTGSILTPRISNKKSYFSVI